MPFTFAHPAIVLPLNGLHKKWFSLTGLVVGSITPDFEYFIRMKIQSIYSHTLIGIFWFDLPIGILLAFAYHLIARDALIQNLPIILRSRFNQFTGFSWNLYFRKHWLIVVISIILGAGSHLFWDSFTHQNGYFVHHIPAFAGKVSVAGKNIYGFKILQHISTLIGFTIIVFAILQLPAQNLCDKAKSTLYWTYFTAIVIGIIAIRLFFGLSLRQYGDLIVTAIAAALMALIFVPVLFGKHVLTSNGGW